MRVFNREYEKLEDERNRKEQIKQDLNKLKKERLRGKDIMALVIAMFQLILPFAIGVIAIYFVVILFMTKVWMK